MTHDVTAQTRASSTVTVLSGGRVRTPQGVIRADVIVRDGTIDRVLEGGAPPPEGARVLDCTGGLVLPGFQDAHVHPPTAGRNLLHLSLHDLPDAAAYLSAIEAYAAEHPERGWILGGGWAMENFPGGLPTKDELDRICPERPVFLYNRDVHGAWANSAALAVAGITAETPDPSDGRIERDPRTSEPTGMLHEGAAYSFEATWVPSPDQQEWEQAILLSQRYLHSLGITTWQDAWVTPQTQAAYAALDARSELTARVEGALWWDRHTGPEQVADLVRRRAEGSTRRFSPTSVKIMTDGVLENATGALLRPYCDGHGHETENLGLTYLDADQLAEAVTALDAEGFSVHMHTIGDRAVRNALDAVEQARRANGIPHEGRSRRHHLAHIQVIDAQDAPRFAELDVTANCQALWAQREPQMTDLTEPFMGPERMERMYPFAEIAAAGGRLAMGSDWSVSTPDPLQQIEVAVTRRPTGDPDAEPLLPDQALTLDQALDAFTLGSAYVNGLDEITGQVTSGFAADLVVLDRDITAAPAHEIAQARVRWTMVAGEVVHAAE